MNDFTVLDGVCDGCRLPSVGGHVVGESLGGDDAVIKPDLLHDDVADELPSRDLNPATRCAANLTDTPCGHSHLSTFCRCTYVKVIIS